MMGSPTIDPLVPDLLDLMKKGTHENELDLSTLIPLRKVGSPTADVAIPIICDLIASNRPEGDRIEAIEALQDFKPPAVLSARPVLEACLSDESEKIRSAALETLTRLGYAAEI
jgi:HEAT repeat protein